MITPENIIRHELIGLQVEVANSTNKFQKGIRGLVVDETKNLLTIETADGIKRIQKKGAEFIFTVPGGKKIKVSGTLIEKRHEDRLKLKAKKW